MDLPLMKNPPASWQAEYHELLKDPYLKKKYNRARRIRDKIAYIDDFLPEVKKGGGAVLDIGPGPGEFLEICRKYGNEVYGIDARLADCEMGDEYIRLSRLMTKLQKVQVWYNGFSGLKIPLDNENLTVINSQGSIEQVLKEHLTGPPHKKTKKAALLSWTGDDKMAAAIKKLFGEFQRTLESGGVICIWANGAKNTEVWTKMVDACADYYGWTPLIKKGLRLRKWQKPA